MHVHMKIDIKIKPRSLVYDQAIYMETFHYRR